MHVTLVVNRARKRTALRYDELRNFIKMQTISFVLQLHLSLNLLFIQLISDYFQTFQDCSCIANENSNLSFSLPESLRNSEKAQNFGSVGSAVGGPCPVDCNREFILFLIVMCFIKFTSATGRASNFLVSVRCVKERDKTVSMGFGLMFMCLFSFMPSPIFFGALFDKFCIVWGKTCNGKGNCWLYDGESLR